MNPKSIVRSNPSRLCSAIFRGSTSLAMLLCLCILLLHSGKPANAQLRQYALAPGDTIRIVVEGLVDYSFSEVLIRPDGQVNLPIYGNVFASGKTVPQLQTELRRIIGKRIRRPERLTVTLIRPRPATPSWVSVQGTAVRASTRVDVGDDGMRLTSVLAAVGGTQGRLEELKATVARLGKPPEEVDLYKATTDPSSSANIRLGKDDVLTVNVTDPPSLTLQGDVTRPGTYLLRRTPSPSATAYDIPLKPKLTDLLLSAGGLKYPTPVDKDMEFTGYITRGNQKISLKPLDAINYITEAANVPLQAGDIVNITAVVIPPVSVFIDGLVRQPGNLQLKPGNGIVEAIAKAGSLTEDVNDVVVTIRRGDKVIPVDLYKAVVSNDPKSNVPLQTDDFIQVRESNKIEVQVTGKVVRSGSMRVEPGTRLLSVLNQAGNLSVKNDNARMKILRTAPDGKQIKLDIDPAALYALDLTQNAVLQDKDIVSVTEFIEEEPEKVKKTVYVSGEVARQGEYDLEEGEGLIEVLVRAGGATPGAALTQVKRQRNGEVKTIDLYSALTQGTESVKEELQRGDVIVVPRNTNRVVVMDAVNKPGDVTIPEKGTLTLVDAINAAGGFKPNAKTTEIAILRPVNGGLKRIDVAVVKGVPSTREPLQNNDLVYVPQGKAPKDLASKFAPLLGIIGIANGLG